MCGRFTLDIDERFYPRFRLDKVIFDFPPNYNISPGQTTPIILKGNNRSVKMMNWGFLPAWSKSIQDKFRPINAKIETIDQKNIFRSSLLKQRCIIPANGFYEWKKTQDQKQPWYFHPKENKYFAFAGIFSIWNKKSDEIPFYSYTILTRPANALIKKVHERMPVILNKEQEEIWLFEEDKNKALEMIGTEKDIAIESYMVSNNVNSPKNNSKELIAPLFSEYPHIF